MIYISVGILIIGFIALMYPRIEKIYLQRPYLVAEIKPNVGITKTQTPIGLSSKNNPGPIDSGDEKVWRIYEFEWRFDLVIRNNSEVNAYHIVPLQHTNKTKVQFEKIINSNKALLAQKEVVLPFRITNIVECQEKDRKSHFGNMPKTLADFMIVFEYQNPLTTKFYSRYYLNTNKTTFQRIKRKELNKYWH